MPGMPAAPLAVLAHGDSVRVVALGLVGLVIAALALLAGEGDSDPNISTGHDGDSEERVAAPGKGKPRTGARSTSQDSALPAQARTRPGEDTVRTCQPPCS